MELLVNIDVDDLEQAVVFYEQAVGELLRAIDGYRGNFVTQCALRLAPLTFVRPGELRKAEWSEIDFETAEWRIPAERMKMGAVHIVPWPAFPREVKTLPDPGTSDCASAPEHPASWTDDSCH